MKKQKKAIQQECYIAYKEKYFVFSKTGFRLTLYNKDALPNFWQIIEKQSTQELDELLRWYDNIYFATEQYDGKTIKQLEKKILNLLWK